MWCLGINEKQTIGSHSFEFDFEDDHAHGYNLVLNREVNRLKKRWDEQCVQWTVTGITRVHIRENIVLTSIDYTVKA